MFYRRRLFNLRRVLGLAVFFILFFFAQNAFAKTATFYLETKLSTVNTEDVFIVTLKVSSPDDTINASEGRILFDKNILEVKELSMGNSIFDVWLTEPISSKKGEIKFIGGIKNGWKGEGEVLKAIFLAKKAGDANLRFGDDLAVYLNDGKGTQLNPWQRSLDIKVESRPETISPKDEWQEVIQRDRDLPDSFKIKIGRNPAIFNNKYFITFSTTDEGTGIDYYEVKEGKRGVVRGESPYLLKDQSLSSIIKVVAVDKAGNRQESELAATNLVQPKEKLVTTVIKVAGAIVVLGFILFVFIYLKFLKRKKWRRKK